MRFRSSIAAPGCDSSWGSSIGACHTVAPVDREIAKSRYASGDGGSIAPSITPTAITRPSLAPCPAYTVSGDCPRYDTGLPNLSVWLTHRGVVIGGGGSVTAL
ncbi:MAG: hypothetical protein NTV94_08545 [Planctomycetota bacterium]|nr:hypothetical protein [Planctomycetota bacterium]